MPKTKPIYLSKGILLGVVTVLAALAQSRFGWGWAIDADVQMLLVGLLVLAVRFVTKDGVRFSNLTAGDLAAAQKKDNGAACPKCGILLRFHEKGKPCPFGVTPHEPPTIIP